jgi:hypothetical protein
VLQDPVMVDVLVEWDCCCDGDLCAYSSLQTLAWEVENNSFGSLAHIVVVVASAPTGVSLVESLFAMQTELREILASLELLTSFFWPVLLLNLKFLRAKDFDKKDDASLSLSSHNLILTTPSQVQPSSFAPYTKQLR